MWALERLDDCTKHDGLGPQYTRMKASWAGVEALASAVWLLWMARYTEYSIIFPDVTEGGSQVRWAPSGLWEGTANRCYSVAETTAHVIMYGPCKIYNTAFPPPFFFYLADFDGTRCPWEAW